MGILAGVVVVGGAAYAATNLGGFRSVHTTVPGTAVRRHATTPGSTPGTTPTAHPGGHPTMAMLRMPVAGRVAAPFGWVYSTRLGEWYYNPGVTLAATPGELVHAGWGGRVTAVGQEPLMGLTVEVNDGNGFTTFYGSLGQANVKVGQVLSQGAVIGTVAAPSLYTRVAGSHLDFQVFQKNQAVNPAHFVKASS
ncbi:MAG: M23 family metallopeptidase [Thermaerobacter sp.]|nr:M23 family metallopeptidase [Thermaerobacter sp.]